MVQLDQQCLSANERSKRPGMVAHTFFNPSTREAEAGRFLSSRTAWSRKWVPGQPGLHRETVSPKNKNKNQTNKKIECPLTLYRRDKQLQLAASHKWGSPDTCQILYPPFFFLRHFGCLKRSFDIIIYSLDIFLCSSTCRLTYIMRSILYCVLVRTFGKYVLLKN